MKRGCFSVVKHDRCRAERAICVSPPLHRCALAGLLRPACSRRHPIRQWSIMTYQAKFNIHSGRGRMTAPHASGQHQGLRRDDHHDRIGQQRLRGAAVQSTRNRLTSSYPSSYYPANSNPSSYPETIIRERVIHSSAAQNSARAVPATQIVNRDSAHSTGMKPDPQRDPLTRLASTSTHRAPSHLPASGSYDAGPSMYEYVSPYRSTMIDSARRSAAQFRLIAAVSP